MTLKAIRWQVRRNVATHLLILLLVIIMTAACSSGGGTPPASGSGGGSPQAQSGSGGDGGTSGGDSAPAAEPERVTIKDGILNCTSVCGFEFMALHKGYFDEANLDVEFVQNENNVNLTKALLAGELDVIEVTPDTAIVAAAQGGQGIKIIGGTVPGLNFVLYVNDSINSIEDLPGKRVGISQPGALPQLLVMYALSNAGLDPNSVQWVAAGSNPQRVQALIEGKIDAAPSPNDFIPTIEQHSNLKVLLNFGTDLPNWIRYGLITTDEVIAEKADALQRFMIAYAKGIRYAIENGDETVALTAEILNQDPSEPALRFGYDWNVDNKLVAPDMSVTEEKVQFMIDLARDSGRLTKDLKVEDVFDPRFQEGVVKELGAYSW